MWLGRAAPFLVTQLCHSTLLCDNLPIIWFSLWLATPENACVCMLLFLLLKFFLFFFTLFHFVSVFPLMSSNFLVKGVYLVDIISPEKTDWKLTSKCKVSKSGVHITLENPYIIVKIYVLQIGYTSPILKIFFFIHILFIRVPTDKKKNGWKPLI